ncbi:MAG: transglycosylase SLT domain-containing protein [Candidatus Eisenbacteria bacterium]|jgi:hypothetical protein|nr:transglycosylase SLT domain-containing protein [Candidatus Eisenbacteria bacterium]
MVISCIIPPSLRAAPPILGDVLELPLIAQSGPGETVWRNPASLARTPGFRAWGGAILPREAQRIAFRSAGASAALGFGLPLFCSSEIPAVARSTGVDSTLAAALVAAESGFNPRAVSVTGARGLTQLTSSTARSLGVYNRHWPRWNLWGGLTYLAQMRRLFGDDELALAAYNVGPGTVRRKGRAVLQDPAVAAYVASITRLRKAYAMRYPERCARGGNGVALGYAHSGDESAGALGWGFDVQSFFELGAGWSVWQRGDSTVSDPVVGARMYLLDPLLVAGAYHWHDQSWEAGGLIALQGERVLFGGERDRSGGFVGAMKVALPLGLWVEAKARRHMVLLGAAIETGRFAMGVAQLATASKKRGAETVRQSVFLSFGRHPAL